MALYDIYALTGKRKDKGALAFDSFKSRKEASTVAGIEMTQMEWASLKEMNPKARLVVRKRRGY